MSIRVERRDVVTTVVIDRRCLLSDRRSCYDATGLSLEAALAREFELGRESLEAPEAREGAQRFAAGAGRHGRP